MLRRRNRRSLHQSDAAASARISGRRGSIRPSRTRIPSPASIRSTTASAHSPTNNPISYRRRHLARTGGQPERDARFLSEPSQPGDLRILARCVLFQQLGTTFENSCPAGSNASLPIGAVVVGGGTTLNGASQITNGGTNAGSNLCAVRNSIHLVSDQVTLHSRQAFARVRRLAPARAGQRHPRSKINTGRLRSRSLANFLTGVGEHLYLRASIDAAVLELARRRLLSSRTRSS